MACGCLGLSFGAQCINLNCDYRVPLAGKLNTAPGGHLIGMVCETSVEGMVIVEQKLSKSKFVINGQELAAIPQYIELYYTTSALLHAPSSRFISTYCKPPFRCPEITAHDQN